jgi:hypothetical protein
MKLLCFRASLNFLAWHAFYISSFFGNFTLKIFPIKKIEIPSQYYRFNMNKANLNPPSDAIS